MSEQEIKRRGKQMAGDVFEVELEQIQQLRKDAKEDNLVGLAFSGGGIRSATVNLGVLQTLAKHKLLGKFDYLSTVSGGGYIGAFFTSMLKHANGDINKVQEKLDGSWIDATAPRQRFAEVSFLRQYSNYLTPKMGFSSDTMAAISVWATNTILNQVVLFTAIATIAAVGYTLNELLNIYLPIHGNAVIAILGLILCLCVTWIAWKESDEGSNNYSQQRQVSHATSPPSRWLLILILGWVGVWLMALYFSNPEVVFFEKIHNLNMYLSSLLTFNGAGGKVVHVSTFWPMVTLLVGAISLGLILFIGAAGRGVLGHYITSFCREWWARLGGVSSAWCAGWLAGVLLFLVLPISLESWLINHPMDSTNALGTISGVWGAITAGAVFLGKSSSTGGVNMQKIKEKLAVFLPWVVIAGLVVLISLCVHHGAVWLNQKMGYGSIVVCQTYAVLALICASVCLFFAWRVDVNIFSLHYFYRNRLTRCYLGATNSNRNPSPFTGFDPQDDVSLADCKDQRPLHIINTALNLTSSANLAWQQRMAASFAFTPLYSGFEFPNGEGGYRPTRYYTGSKGVQIGSAISVSGAAASPNMGYHSAPATAFLMTMFNARLGRWYGNPAVKCDGWTKPSPSFGLRYLFKELFLRAGVDSNYVYLSDGGHFENLGIYELVRRKCKLIIAVDAGADGDYHFEDIGNAMRKCEVDLNVTIELDLAEIHPTVTSPYNGTKFSSKHYAVGTIRYDGDAKHNGILVYIKNSMTGREPSDLINFKLDQPAFPHHSTVDQFFNESQFESYRNLGGYIAEQVVKSLRAGNDKAELEAAQILGVRPNFVATKSAVKKTTIKKTALKKAAVKKVAIKKATTRKTAAKTA